MISEIEHKSLPDLERIYNTFLLPLTPRSNRSLPGYWNNPGLKRKANNESQATYCNPLHQQVYMNEDLNSTMDHEEQCSNNEQNQLLACKEHLPKDLFAEQKLLKRAADTALQLGNSCGDIHFSSNKMENADYFCNGYGYKSFCKRVKLGINK